MLPVGWFIPVALPYRHIQFWFYLGTNQLNPGTMLLYARIEKNLNSTILLVQSKGSVMQFEITLPVYSISTQ